MSERKVIDFECVLPNDEHGKSRQSFEGMSHRIGYGDPELLPELPGYGFANYEHIFAKRDKSEAPAADKPKKRGLSMNDFVAELDREGVALSVLGRLDNYQLADILKTYVRMGMGVGIVAPMAYECQDQKDLTALSAAGLFPRVTTWLGFRRDSVLRRYMVDFIALFAPHLTPQLTRKAAQLTTQTEVDELFDEAQLPVRGGCDESPCAVARL